MQEKLKITLVVLAAAFACAKVAHGGAVPGGWHLIVNGEITAKEASAITAKSHKARVRIAMKAIVKAATEGYSEAYFSTDDCRDGWASILKEKGFTVERRGCNPTLVCHCDNLISW